MTALDPHPSAIGRPPLTERFAAWLHGKRNVEGLIGMILVGTVITLTLLAPWIAPFPPDEIDLLALLEPPSLTSGHLLGTDSLGQDLFSRILHGGRMPLTIVLVAVAGSAAFGIALGLLAGARGGWVDQLASRLADVQLALPAILLALVLLAFAGVNVFNLILVIGLATWPVQFRISRAHAMSLRRIAFIEAAAMFGGSQAAIIWRHYLPNVLPLAIVTSTLAISAGLLLEASLSYLGLGVQPPTPDWGQMVAAGQTQLGSAWWLSIAPGIALLMLLLGVQLLGDWLSERLSVQGLIRQGGR